MKLFRIIIGLVSALWLVACTDPDVFVINGEIAGGGMQTIDLIYYGRGGMQCVSVPADKGRFIIRGTSPSPSLGMLYINGSDLLGSLIVQNGEEVSCKFSLEKPGVYEISGNKASQDAAKFVSANADLIKSGDAARINAAVADFVAKNPDNMASTLLMVTQFYTPGFEETADSLIGLVTPKARPAGVMQTFNTVLSDQLTTQARTQVQAMQLYDVRDTTYRYNPRQHSYSMLVFATYIGLGRDSVTSMLSKMSNRYPKERFSAVEVSVAPDSIRWRSTVGRDDAKWARVWTPGTLASPLFKKFAVPRVPFFIVADSTGAQLYRGSSVKAAEAAVVDRLGIPADDIYGF